MLARNYVGAVQMLAQYRRERSEQQQLGRWALRASSTAWAVVRAGRLWMTNRPFDRLNSASVIGPRWQRVRAPGEPAVDEAGRSLSQLVLEEASHLQDPSSESRTSRHSRGRQIIELTVEVSQESPGQSMVLCLVRDISQTAAAEARAAALHAKLVERERVGLAGELAVGVAHDLGNLVAALRARLAVLETDAALAGGRAEGLRDLQAIADAQASLVARLKGLARPRAEVPAAVELLPDVVRPALQMVDSWLRIRDRRHPITVEVRPEVAALPPVLGLRNELVNVLINLFLNARDAMPDGGQVQLGGGAQDGSVVLRIEDQGIGIAPENLVRIFEPLFTTKGASGMGMGLSMAANLMTRLGGAITVHNRPEGGACFELRFRPAAAEAAAE